MDRNLVSADAIRERLNSLVDDVRQALKDPEIVAAYMRDTRSTEEDFSWTKCLSDESLFGETSSKPSLVKAEHTGIMAVECYLS